MAIEVIWGKFPHSHETTSFQSKAEPDVKTCASATYKALNNIGSDCKGLKGKLDENNKDRELPCLMTSLKVGLKQKECAKFLEAKSSAVASLTPLTFLHRAHRCILISQFI